MTVHCIICHWSLDHYVRLTSKWPWSCRVDHWPVDCDIRSKIVLWCVDQSVVCQTRGTILWAKNRYDFCWFKINTSIYQKLQKFFIKRNETWFTEQKSNILLFFIDKHVHNKFACAESCFTWLYSDQSASCLYPALGYGECSKSSHHR